MPRYNPAQGNVKGECFAVAYRTFASLPPGEATLVHGTARMTATGRHGAHAWVELGDVIFDNENGMVRRARFYDALEARAGTRYADLDLVMLLLARTGNYGPWTAAERADAEQALGRLRSRSREKIKQKV